MSSHKCTILVMSRTATLKQAHISALCLKKYWKDCRFETVLCTQMQDPEYDLFDRVIHCDDELIWGDRLRVAMDNINTSYTFLLAEDFFLTKKLDNSRFENAIKLMEKNDVGAMWLSTAPLFSKKIKGNRELKIVPKSSIYRICLQPILFKTEYLKRFAGLHFSPWQFERKASLISAYMNEKVMAVTNPIYPCVHAWSHGMWSCEAVDFMKSEGIDPSFYEEDKIYPRTMSIKDKLAITAIKIAPHLITHIRIVQSEKNEKKLQY